MVTYFVPAKQAEAYGERDVVLVSSNPADLAAAVAARDPERTVFMQLTSLEAGADAVKELGQQDPVDHPVPLDLVMENPEPDYPLLYEFVPLLGVRPVRVSIPVVPGFGKAVKVAASLELAIKLEVGQPDAGLVEALLEVLDDYLHDSTVSQPIEFFHSVLFAFYREAPPSLWAIQQEDPALFRFVTAEGEETVAARIAALGLDGDPDSLVDALGEKLLGDNAECAACDFSPCCRGYFKCPGPDYSCAGIKQIFRTLKEAARDLEEDLTALKEEKKDSRA
jgi:hypothetical protein